ncbi:MAG: hypothetical protein ACERKZ_06430 [Lachnotalea sp.]
MAVVKEIYEVKKDPEFQNSYIDMDEWRDRVLPDGSKAKFRYVHGGVEKKGLKFVFCMPEKEKYTGRFFHYLSPFPGPDEEVASLERTGVDDRIGFALMHGAYYVESNMGSTAMFGPKSDNTLVWKASAAAAEISRDVAEEMYQAGRPYGYVYGGSGGGYKSLACIENTNAWDGAAPFVIGSPVSLPNTITLHAQGQRCLRHVFGKIVDALEPGGSGNMYEGLTNDEAVMLKEITQMGFPPKAWFIEASGKIDDGSLPVLTPGVKMSDPTYFTEFWEVPGYMGADLNSNARRDRLQFDGVVKSVHVPGQKKEESAIDGRNGVDDAWQKQLADGAGAWIELEEVPHGDDLYLKGVNITFSSGETVGKTLLLDKIEGNRLTIGMCFGMDDLNSVIASIQPGDKIHLDNSDYIAIQSYYRHQVPSDLSFHAWDQFRNSDGTPSLPQRANIMGYGFTGTGTVQDGNIQGKVILTQSLMDESTCPWCGDWYRKKVIETKGNEDDFRIYYMEHCLHGDISILQNNHIVNYLGVLYQVLLDLSDWVERGIQPLHSTAYELKEGQIYPEEDIVSRKGIQPKVTLLANARECAHVKLGEEITFTVNAEVPEGAGKVTAVDYSFEDHAEIPCENAFPVSGSITETYNGAAYGATSQIKYAYSQPGTFFTSVRVMSNRQGSLNNPTTQVLNLARVRVIVE